MMLDSRPRFVRGHVAGPRGGGRSKDLDDEQSRKPTHR